MHFNCVALKAQNQFKRSFSWDIVNLTELVQSTRRSLELVHWTQISLSLINFDADVNAKMNGCVCELPRNENFLIQIASWFCHLNFNYPAGGGRGRAGDLDSDASVSPVTLTQVTQRQQKQFECQNWRETCEHVTWTLAESATLGWMPRKALCAMRHAWLSLIPLVSLTQCSY